MELRLSMTTSTFPSFVSTTPRLVEVWTRFGMSGLMASTPWGTLTRRPITARASSADMTWSALAAFELMARPGSKAPRAAFQFASSLASSAFSSASRAGIEEENRRRLTGNGVALVAALDARELEGEAGQRELRGPGPGCAGRCRGPR